MPIRQKLNDKHKKKSEYNTIEIENNDKILTHTKWE